MNPLFDEEALREHDARVRERAERRRLRGSGRGAGLRARLGAAMVAAGLRLSGGVAR